MNREKLISYSFYYGGEYGQIEKAIAEDEPYRECKVENALTILDEDYPKKLRDLEKAPYVLYYKGDLSLLRQEAIGVVGSRNPCDYALQATRKLVKANNDKVIISGLAKGIDACAHENALKTIGVLGCGIDYIYPFCNYDLIRKVEKTGLILSEYPGLSKPYGYHFPFRNRIIAALSERVYVMQSAKKSGTMTTVNEALHLGKAVSVLPYDLFAEEGRQNNLLIYEGADPIMIEEIAI